jgi:hypothetical protein
LSVKGSSALSRFTLTVVPLCQVNERRFPLGNAVSEVYNCLNGMSANANRNDNETVSTAFPAKFFNHLLMIFNDHRRGLNAIDK